MHRELLIPLVRLVEPEWPYGVCLQKEFGFVRNKYSGNSHIPQPLTHKHQSPERLLVQQEFRNLGMALKIQLGSCTLREGPFKFPVSVLKHCFNCKGMNRHQSIGCFSSSPVPPRECGLPAARGCVGADRSLWSTRGEANKQTSLEEGND